MNDSFEENLGISRRTLLKRGAIVGGGLVWAAPAVQTLAKPAAAATPNSTCTGKVIVSPVPGICIYIGNATFGGGCCHCLKDHPGHPELCTPLQGVNCTPISFTPVPPSIVTCPH